MIETITAEDSGMNEIEKFHLWWQGHVDYQDLTPKFILDGTDEEVGRVFRQMYLETLLDHLGMDESDREALKEWL